MSFKVKRCDISAIIPTRAHSGDAGWDLYANNEEPIHLEFGNRVLIPTGCQVSIPIGYYGRVADRSGNAWKYGIHVLAGVIDSQYRGEVKVVLANLGYDGFMIKKGDRIAQLIITKIHEGDIIEVDNLDGTERSERGFGSREGSDRVVLDRLVFDRLVFDRLVLDRLVLDRLVLDRLVLDRLVLDRLVFDRLVFDRLVFDRLVFDRLVFDRLANNLILYIFNLL
jgi:dUTP pyrophosphatase